MKSALIITGNLRSFEKSYNTFEQIIDIFNCDIFICLSDIQFDLHQFQKKKLNFFNDCKLSLNLLNTKLSICKNMNDKTKKIFLLDKIEEDNDINNNYLHLFDNTKKWTGIDIFKQFNKLKTCVNYIQKYEIDNNIKYNYIIKTRFDININLNSLPLFPLLDNTIYTNEYEQQQICDNIIITNNIQNLEKICEDLNNHFFNNSCNIEKYDSIHTMLFNIFTINNFNSIQKMCSVINREYSSCFDTNITLVTCFYYINRDKWGLHSRTTDKYFENAENILNKKNPIVIFTTEDYKNRCIEIRKKTDINLIHTKIIIIPFEQLTYYDKLEQIRTIQQNNISNIPIACNSCPEFCVPEYIVIINNKICFLNQVANENFFNSQIFQWVDFGTHKNLYYFDEKYFDENYFTKIFYKKDKLRIVGFNNPKPIYDKIQYYNTHFDTTCCTLFGGDKNIINTFFNLCKTEFEYLLNNNIINQEQYIYYYLLSEYPNLFDYSIINNWNDLCKSYSTNTTKIAICMSGHIRTFDLCKSNIINNIVNPLIDANCDVNIFCSTWNDIDFTNNLSNLQNFCTVLLSEDYHSNFFINNYNTQQYLQFPGLCCNTTLPNAVSMFYKIQSTFELCEEYSSRNNIEYDIIIRIRPDIVYNNIIDIGNIKKSLLTNELYMPYSHGKYTTVTKNIMDHFFYGNIEIMQKITKMYSIIYKLITTNSIHTAEGLFFENINIYNTIVYRFFCSYGVIRENNKYEKILE
jgi:hypothetical protein